MIAVTVETLHYSRNKDYYREWGGRVFYCVILVYRYKATRKCRCTIEIRVKTESKHNSQFNFEARTAFKILKLSVRWKSKVRGCFSCNAIHVEVFFYTTWYTANNPFCRLTLSNPKPGPEWGEIAVLGGWSF